jgi:hypothetical protein
VANKTKTEFEEKERIIFQNIQFLQDQVFQMKNPIRLMLFRELMELIHHEK